MKGLFSEDVGLSGGQAKPGCPWEDLPQRLPPSPVFEEVSFGFDLPSLHLLSDLGMCPQG